MPVVFLFSGVLDTLCTQQLVYQGASGNFVTLALL